MRSVPRAVVRGDVLRVVAPSGPFEHQGFQRACAFLGQRYRLRMRSSVLARDGFLAGRDVERGAALREAMLDREASAILCVRGGYGLDRIVEDLPWRRFVERPKWLVGFSDVTALHLEANRRGVLSLHAPNMGSLGTANSMTRWNFIKRLEHPIRTEKRVLTGWAAGTARGPLIGGNLTVLFAAAVAGRLRLPSGAILLLEDVTEMPYRIDRMLTTLRRGGHLETIGGVVLGEFTNCKPGRDGVTAKEVLRERLSSWGCPVASGIPVGHGDVNQPLVLGGQSCLTVVGEHAELL